MKKEKKTIYLVLQMSQGSGAVYTSMVSNSGWWHGKDIGVYIISACIRKYIFYWPATNAAQKQTFCWCKSMSIPL